MMMKCKKQFIALFMAISVIFCVGSETYIKAEALEWAVPTITAGEAIKWLLGLLGVTVAGGALANTDYEQLAENYTEYAHQQGLSAVETGKFWADIIDGTLDQGSQAWSTFKEWVSSLTSTSGISNLDSFANHYGVNIVGADTIAANFKFDTIIRDSSYADNNPNYAGYYYLFDASSIDIGSNSISITYDGFVALRRAQKLNNIYNYNVQSVTLNQPYVVNINYVSFASSLDYIKNNALSVFEYPFGENVDGNYNVYDNTLINTLALTLSSAISDAIPDVIPLPWDQVSDTAEGINEKIDELIEKVNEGVISLEDYMTAVQNLLGVLAFNPANDLVIPADPALPDLTIQDKIEDNVTNNGFVLTGLENFFPFCIPFDIYSFITILVAEPVAPVIHWHIYNPVTKTDNIMTLDFAMWEPVVILFRYIFDFLFIIGLALIARSLIGGDD